MPRPKTRTSELKDRMLAESMSLLHAEGPSGVTARGVATVAGTSTAAVYELFGNKAGLVRSIFYEGFSQLAERLDGVEPTGDPRSDLVGVLDATRDFALANPMLFEVMFARPFAEFEPSPDDDEAAGRIYQHVIQAVSVLLDTRRSDPTVVDSAHVVVAVNHGLISAELGGLLGRSEASIRRRRTLALESTMVGLVASRGDR